MKLYVYDHCPFCVKARTIFGLANISFDLAILLNDDEETPTRMIGKKMAPILDHDGRFIPESMDIVAYIDNLAGGDTLPGPTNPQVAAWISEVTEPLYRLAMPRWAAAPLPEFATAEARAYFTRNKENAIGGFAGHLAKSEEYIGRLNAHLLDLAPIIQSSDAVNGIISSDDIHLFATLRAMSIVEDVIYPPAVDAYRRGMAQATGVELHDDLGIRPADSN